jgi:hypothetical protein
MALGPVPRPLEKRTLYVKFGGTPGWTHLDQQYKLYQVKDQIGKQTLFFQALRKT